MNSCVSFKSALMLRAQKREFPSLLIQLQPGEKENSTTSYIFRRNRAYNESWQNLILLNLSCFTCTQIFWAFFKVVDNNITIFVLCFLSLAFFLEKKNGMQSSIYERKCGEVVDNKPGRKSGLDTFSFRI